TRARRAPVRRRPVAASRGAGRRFLPAQAGRLAPVVRRRGRLRRARCDAGRGGGRPRGRTEGRGPGARRAHGALARGARRVITADAAPHAARPEPRDARMLLAVGSRVVAQTVRGKRTTLLKDAQDAAYSPDGTLVAFARGGDIWLANADGTGQRRL